MKNALYVLCIFTFACLQSNAQTKTAFAIIPQPNSVMARDGSFVLNTSTQIAYDTDSDKKTANLFQSFIKNAYGLNLPIQQSGEGDHLIYFSSKNAAGLTNEAYELQVDPDKVVLKGKEAGLFYAYETLLQILPDTLTGQLTIPAVTIKDQPRYAYRGLHLDVGRHFFPVSYIKKYIDLIAAYKLNNFHWHLTEDQGWRIEIKKYPKLTQIGAFRDQTLLGRYRNPGEYDSIRYGGFYTQDEVKEVVAYAAARYVKVIPEIEMPGHALAALASYPELACGDHPGPFKVGQTWGVFDDVYCAGKEETFKFIENVLDEVLPLFPSTYIHIGGDECPKTRWKTCPYCQKRMKDNGLKDEHGLQSYFIQRIEKYLNSKGRRIIGWDEILEGGLAPNATVMSWRGEEGGIDAAKQGHDVIMTANSYGLYFDHKQGPDSEREPLSIGGYSSLQKVYIAEPTPKGLSAEEQKHILGVQANVWTEYIETSNKVDFMVLPRIYALSEIAWTAPEHKDWKNFSEVRVPARLAVLDLTGTTYRVPEVIGLKDTVVYASSYLVDQLLPSVKGGKIYYTLNGLDPSETDKEYKGPITVNVPAGKQRVFKAIVVAPSGRTSNFVETVIVNTKKK
ncbi:hexosaminidase [bacterium A37T11]|nr:hexosaminidase [bacterium A37T11]